MFTFEIVLKHDAGTVKITTTASSMTECIKQVLREERAPERAIVSVTNLGPVVDD